MLCGHCQRQQDGNSAGPRTRERDADGSVLELLFCSRCHAVLPIPDPTGRMLSALELLAGFGLTGRGGPLLVRNSEPA